MIYSNCFLKYFNGAAEKAQCMKSLPCHPKDLSAITAHVENSENVGFACHPSPEEVETGGHVGLTGLPA